MKKYPSVDRIGSDSVDGILKKPVTVLEKMDGANFRFTMGKNVEGSPDDVLIFGSRNVIYRDGPVEDENFEHAARYVRDQVPLSDPDWWESTVERDDDALTIYGEAMHSHTLDYGSARHPGDGAAIWDEVPNVLVFDVWSEEDGWLSWPSVKAVARRLNLETVPEIYDRRRYESVDELPDSIESEYRDGGAEGIVIRRPRGGSKNDIWRAKLRSEEFLDKHASASRDPSTYDDTDSVELARSLLRKEPWVQKMIHKYRDEGRDIHMGIMEDLWRDVFDDIIEEEYEEVFLGNWEINTKKFRSEIASHTADELHAYLNRPDDSVLNQEADA
jgi:hypothetical protein